MAIPQFSGIAPGIAIPVAIDSNATAFFLRVLPTRVPVSHIAIAIEQ